jgi:hypothetical protein
MPGLNPTTLKLTFGALLVGYSAYALLRGSRQVQQLAGGLLSEQDEQGLIDANYLDGRIKPLVRRVSALARNRGYV